MSSGEGGQFLFMNKSSSLTSCIGIQGNEYERNPAKHFVNRKFAPSLLRSLSFHGNCTSESKIPRATHAIIVEEIDTLFPREKV